MHVPRTRAAGVSQPDTNAADDDDDDDDDGDGTGTAEAANAPQASHVQPASVEQKAQAPQSKKTRGKKGRVPPPSTHKHDDDSDDARTARHQQLVPAHSSDDDDDGDDGDLVARMNRVKVKGRRSK